MSPDSLVPELMVEVSSSLPMETMLEDSEGEKGRAGKVGRLMAWQGGLEIRDGCRYRVPDSRFLPIFFMT